MSKYFIISPVKVSVIPGCLKRAGPYHLGEQRARWWGRRAIHTVGRNGITGENGLNCEGRRTQVFGKGVEQDQC
ncbi:MAG: hypothetical protein QOI34_1226 [Verrucomicrobiota bacterium]|jgi:hypothetical protein